MSVLKELGNAVLARPSDDPNRNLDSYPHNVNTEFRSGLTGPEAVIGAVVVGLVVEVYAKLRRSANGRWRNPRIGL